MVTKIGSQIKQANAAWRRAVCRDVADSRGKVQSAPTAARENVEASLPLDIQHSDPPAANNGQFDRIIKLIFSPDI